jgi:hypothetical protein
MIEIGNLTALIVAEVFLGMLIVSVLLVVFAVLRKRRIRQAARYLADRVQQDRAVRTERLRTLLHENYQQEGAVLEQSLHNIMQMEMVLYQNIINGFTKDDHLCLQQTDVDVENLVLSYQGLGNSKDPKAAAPVSSDDDEELEHLRTENKRLSDELKVTMDTMGRMLNEYSTMFADGSDFSVKVSGMSQSAPEGVPTESVESEPAQEFVEETEIEPQADAREQAQDEPVAEENLQSDVDEEVSEIIDEVMEMADEMIHEVEAQEADPIQSEPNTDETVLIEKPNLAEESAQTGESMVDDLSKIDIDIPDVDADTLDSSEFEEGSLEEEWAKLLEEESSKPSDDEKG